MNELSHPTSIYLCRPECGIAHGIREYLKASGAATAVEIRRGIANDINAARFLVNEVCVALGRMTKRGILSRDGNIYTLLRAVPQRRIQTPGGALKWKKLAKENVGLVVELSRRVRFELRDELMSELYLLMASGDYELQEKERLFADARKSMARKNFGDIYKPRSFDTPLTDGGITLLDITSNERDRDDNYLTQTEEGASLYE